jgi:hypothetical protein
MGVFFFGNIPNQNKLLATNQLVSKKEPGQMLLATSQLVSKINQKEYQPTDQQGASQQPKEKKPDLRGVKMGGIFPATDGNRARGRK